MKLYYSPNACSLGIHFLLEEAQRPYRIEKVDFADGAQYKPPFVALNPKSKVPLLQLDDRSTISEFPAIAWYIGQQAPSLMPADQVRAIELFDYLIATIHMRGFTRIFRPGLFGRPEDEAQVQQAGRDIITKGFDILAPVLGDHQYILGTFSIVEGALFFLEHWARFRAHVAMPAVFEAHLDRLLARPAAQKVLAAEGLI
jgi:glutathione S-transferase